MRGIASSSPASTTTVTLTVGSLTRDYTITTVPVDNTPDVVAFTPQLSVPLNAIATSNSVVVTGINASTPISVDGGLYRINNLDFTAEDGYVVANDTVQLQLPTPTTPNSNASMVVTIGSSNATFTVTSIAADTTPSAFAFTSVTNAQLNSQNVSNQITVAGINTATPISVTGGEYQIDNEIYLSTPGFVVNGSKVRVRGNAANTVGTTSKVTLAIGGVVQDFNITTVAADITPSSFSFNAANNVQLSAVSSSNTITIAGINTSAPISISGNGTFKVNSNAYTSQASTVNSGDTVTVRLSASALPATSVSTTLTVGTFNTAYTVTTVPVDTTPLAFSFTDVSNADQNVLINSNTVTISGINSPASIAITNGASYRINDEQFGSSANVINNGDTITVRLRSSTNAGTTTSTTLTIGGVSDTFTVTTVPVDTKINPITFTSQSNVAIASTVVSNTVVISGINTDAPISIVGGEYQIGTGSYTSTAGVISNGANLRVRAVASSMPATTTYTTIQIGSDEFNFGITTEAVDTVPNSFTFNALIDQPVSTAVQSNTVKISGINSPTPISISGGTFAINSGAFSSVSNTVNNGDDVRVQLITTRLYSRETNATLTIGGVSATFRVTNIVNDAPTATVTFVDTNGGYALQGDTLVMSYEYADADGDPEGATIITWRYNGNTSSVSTSPTLTLTNSTPGIWTVQVTPRALTGELSGSMVSQSIAVGLPPTVTGTAYYTDENFNGRRGDCFRFFATGFWRFFRTKSHYIS